MIQTAFIIHGSNGNPNKHWYPWLKEELEKLGVKVFAPQFPIRDEQSLNNWLKTLEPFKKYLDNSILIGHSLGVPFILNVLNLWDVKVKASFLVSGFVGHLDVEEPNINDFSERDFDWERIKSHCERFYIFHSDNDPYVPLEKAKKLAEKLGVEIILVQGGEHFQAESGFRKFELLLEEIKEIVFN